MFITFEGPEGSGKTTLIHEISKRWQEEGREHLCTREPGGVEIAEKIRSVILDDDSGDMTSRTEALLYAAARQQHLKEKILPALVNNIPVLCDRFIDSSIAYQGGGRGIGEKEVRDINKFAIGSCEPDITFFLALSPEEGLSRISANEDREVNRFDEETLGFHRKVYETYKNLAANEERIIPVNASLPLDELVDKCMKILDEAL